MTRVLQEPSDLTSGDAGDPWRKFLGEVWRRSIDPHLFLQANYTPYEGDDAFLAPATARTTRLWARLTAMFPQERGRGVYDVDPHTPAAINAHAPGYIDRNAELIVGLQTDAPLTHHAAVRGRWPGSTPDHRPVRPADDYWSNR